MRLFHATKTQAGADEISRTAVIRAGRNLVLDEPVVHFSVDRPRPIALDVMGDAHSREAWVFELDIPAHVVTEPDPADPGIYGEWVIVRAPEVPVVIVDVTYVDIDAELAEEFGPHPAGQP